jgi:hypothetical protein
VQSLSEMFVATSDGTKQPNVLTKDLVLCFEPWHAKLFILTKIFHYSQSVSTVSEIGYSRCIVQYKDTLQLKSAIKQLKN